MTFKSGTEWNGNKNGRPPNSGHRQQLFNSLVEPHKEVLVNTAINLALSGNESMLRLLLERLLPVKPVDDSVIMTMSEENARKSESILAWGEGVLQSVSNGDITPDQGRSLMALINSQRQNIETCELDIRLKAIERALKKRKSSEKKER